MFCDKKPQLKSRERKTTSNMVLENPDGHIQKECKCTTLQMNSQNNFKMNKDLDIRTKAMK